MRDNEKSYKEKLVILSDLSYVAHEYASMAITELMEPNKALRLIDSILSASSYVFNNDNDIEFKIETHNNN